MKYLITALLTCGVTSAYSQTTEGIYRRGFVFGAGIGVAHSTHTFPTKRQKDTGVGLDVKLGYMVKPTLAILLSTNVSSYDYSGFGRNRQRDFGIVAPTIQYWVNDRFWVLGGAGIGVDAPIFWDIENPGTNKEEAEYYTGLGMVTAVGYEFYRKKNFALDIKARVTYRSVTMPEGKVSGFSPAILLGVNFH